MFLTRKMARNKGYRFRRAFLANNNFSNILAKKIGNITKREFEANFDHQGFKDSSVKKWKEVQRRIPSTKAYKYGTKASRTNPILRGKGSGLLARSIKVIRADHLQIKIDVVGKASEYAYFHNKGTAKIPQRKFMGYSRSLNKKVIARIEREINEALKRV